MTSSAVQNCGRKAKWLRVAEFRIPPRTFWWNQKFKKALYAKKNAFKVLLQNRSSSDSQPWYSEPQLKPKNVKRTQMGEV